MRWVAGVLIVAGCALEGFERGDVRIGGGGGGDEDACHPARAPDPPPDPLPGGASRFVVAVRKLSFPPVTGRDPATERDSRTPREQVVGLDLDGRCTCDETFRTTCVPRADAPLENLCDDARGRDNTLTFALAPFGGPMQDDLGARLTTALSAGRWGHLLEVRGYNGARSDGRVRVASYVALPRGAFGAPVWDGEDVWPLWSRSVVSEGRILAPRSRHVAPDAYVTNGVLVARFPRLLLRFETAEWVLPMALSGVTLVAEIVEDPAGHGLDDGVLSGRLAEADGFEMLESYRFGPNREGKVCNGEGEYNVLRSALCGAMDLRTDGDEGALCNAVSAGFGFSADPARLGGVQDAASLDACPPGVEPSADRCGT